MNSSLIGKIEKARTYASEPERITIDTLRCEIRGNNGTHMVTLEAGTWSCDCHFFQDHATCCHSMAMERVLAGMLPSELRASAVPA
jgi:hypothetical protein